MHRIHRASVRFEHVVEYFNSKNLLVVLNYERLLKNKLAIGSSLGFAMVSKYDDEQYFYNELSMKKYRLGTHQGFFLGASTIFRYSSLAKTKYMAELLVNGGSLLLWKRLFTSAQVGVGPGILQNVGIEELEFNPFSFDSRWDVGFTF